MPEPGRAGRMLSDAARDVLSAERAALGRLRELLVLQQAASDDLERLRQAELDLDELFLLVVVGEFNAGKSAFVNALLGERVLREGVTPTTAAITRLRYGPVQDERTEGSIVEVRYPLDLLRDVAVVDTPGTNAVLREHEELTNHFVPRADLVLFVTSVDRPFTETERAFMERIRAWGKKIVVVLNKADLLAGQAELDDQVAFVQGSVERLLGFSPQVFPVSARLALGAKAATDPAERAELWQRSRFEALDQFIASTLDETNRLQLKLSTPLGVAELTSRTYVQAAQEKLALLAEDLRLAERIQSQLDVYRTELREAFAHRLEGLDNLLYEMADRGDRYLDDTVRLARIVDLFRQKGLKEEFERVVVADTPDRVDRLAQDLVDWLVDQDLKLWRSVTEQLERRRALGTGGAAERLTGALEYDRRAVLRSLAETARDVVQRHNHREEATLLAQSVREAVTQTTLIEAGAVGLGAVTMAILGSAAADVTGLVAASVVAGVGLWVLPRKRAQARQRFRARTEELRTRLRSALSDAFDRELERSLQRIQDALAPYDRLTRAEHQQTEQFLEDVRAVLDQLADLRTRVEQVRAAA